MASEAAAAGDLTGGRRTRLWLPLLLPGVLVALSLPLAQLLAQPAPSGNYVIMLRTSATLTHALYLGGLPLGPQEHPLGWYWVGALAVVILGTAAWYRDRIPRRGYLITGLVLVLVAAGLPLAGLGTSAYNPDVTLWTWLVVLWQQGIFALLAIAVSLALLAWLRRSRALAVITGCYAVAVALTAWLDEVQGISVAPGSHADLLPVFPAAVLILAALGTLLAGG
jgi:hypothetical protein